MGQARRVDIEEAASAVGVREVGELFMKSWTIFTNRKWAGDAGEGSERRHGPPVIDIGAMTTLFYPLSCRFSL